ncbi:MAG: hypothetical protein U9Q62_08470 [Campylobacterota bacterium]|nr:hypothetical protein [Campylobacterota bacterium]
MEELMKQFAGTRTKVLELLAPLKPVDFRGTKAEGIEGKLYLVDTSIDKELIYLRSVLESHYASEKDSKQFAFSKIVKHYNPAKPVSRFGLYRQHKWRQISDPEKVRPKLKSELSIFKNIQRNNLEEHIKLFNYSEDEVRELRSSLEKSFLEKEEALEYIEEHFDTLDVRISAHANDKLIYGTISFRTHDQKQYSRHISKELPNVLYYIAQEERPDNELSEYLKEATHAYGEVYYAPLTEKRIERRRIAEKKAKKKGK